MGKVIGKDHIKKDLALKVAGKAIYTADMRMPNLLECRILKSPYAHAKIISIDTSEVEKMPGVRAVLTPKDTDILLSRPFKTGAHNDFYALPPEEVYMAGEQIAAVAAETKEIAQEALKLFKVEYKPLPSILDPADALKPGAPLMYPDLPNNVAPTNSPLTSTRGDIEQGFKESDIILHSVYGWPTQAQAPLEPYQVIAEYKGDEITIWISTQTLWQMQGFISWAFGIPENKITIIGKYVGGGFGGKFGVCQAIPACIAAALSKKTGRPVRCLTEMDEQFIMSHHACGPGYYDTKVGIKKGDGKPMAIDTLMQDNQGGHGVHGLVGTYVVSEAAVSVYEYKNIHVIANPVYCNLNMSGPRRSYGDAEGMFCSEQFADEMAEAVNMDPMEWRLKYCTRPGDPCSLRLEWGELAGGNYEALMKKGAAAFDWKHKWKGWKVPTYVNGPKRRGVGMSLSMHITGSGVSGTFIRINADGTVMVNCTAEEIGQGIKSATAICVAEVLGVRYEDVTLNEDNTKFNPRGGGVFASKGTPTNIGGSIIAAKNARKLLLEKASKLMEVGPDELDIDDGKIFVKSHPSSKKTIAEVVSAGGFGGNCIYAYGEDYWPKINPKTGLKRWEKSLAALFCEAEVDTETGEVSVIKIVTCDDAGVVINPEVALGQCDGGLMMGLGFAKYEDMIFDKAHEGIVINPNLVDYKIPTFPEFGDFISIVHSDPADAPTCQLNAKGMGEATLVPVAPAIANALYNATGVRVKFGPITPDKVLKALGKI